MMCAMMTNHKSNARALGWYRRNDTGSQHDWFASMGRVDATKLDLPSKKLDRKCKFYGVFVNCTQFFKSHFSILSNLCFFYAHKSCEKIFECILPFCFVWIMVSLRNTFIAEDSCFAAVERLDLEACISVLEDVVGDASLLPLISSWNGAGYTRWKDATITEGLSVDDLAIFIAGELRIQKLEAFKSDTFSMFVLREPQDTRVRFEVNGESRRISSLFASVEAMKSQLRLSDYIVSHSQTTLEQVFNVHAAEEELRNIGRTEQAGSAASKPASTCTTCRLQLQS
jgi:hypothetical protein